MAKLYARRYRAALQRGDGQVSGGSGAHQRSGFAEPITPEQFRAWRERHFGLGKPGRRACREYLSVTRWTVWGIENGKWSVSPRIALMMAKLERDPEAREVLEALERLRRAKGSGR